MVQGLCRIGHPPDVPLHSQMVPDTSGGPQTSFPIDFRVQLARGIDFEDLAGHEISIGQPRDVSYPMQTKERSQNGIVYVFPMEKNHFGSYFQLFGIRSQ